MSDNEKTNGSTGPMQVQEGADAKISKGQPDPGLPTADKKTEADVVVVEHTDGEMEIQPGIFVADQMEASYDGVNETAVSFTAP